MCNLYFAYGSNLNEADFKAWSHKNGFSADCLRRIGMAYLPDETLAFDYRSSGRNGGVLNIRPARGCVVEGYLYEVTGDGWNALDRKEGAPRFYRRKLVTVLRPDGSETKAATYRVIPERREDFVLPATDYLELCRSARERLELEAEPLMQAARNEPASPLPDVFVYGTLMRGESRSQAWSHDEASSVLTASAQGRLVNHDDYPGFVIDGSGSVRGECISFRDAGAVLDRFDRIEAFHGFGLAGNLFRRTLVLIDIGAMSPRLAWTYVTCRRDAPAILSGDWRQHQGTRERAMRQILSSYAGKPDFFARLAAAPASPFSTLYDEAPPYEQVVADLVAGRLDERWLRIASRA